MTVLIKRKVLQYILNSATDVNLATWLATQGATSGQVEITIPDGEIIGGTVVDGYALNMGNMSAFTSVVLNVNGEIQGLGGTSGSRDGDGGIYSVYPVTINIAATGAVRSGGGAGGNGGLGGYGTSYSNLEGPYYQSSPKYQYVIVSDGCCRCWWNGIQVGDNRTNIYNLRNGDYWYWYGDNISGGFYYIYRGYARTGVKGVGGAGGVGQGYLQAKTNGSSGGSGTYRAGNGGAGGNGATWGLDASNGGTGTTGYYITSYTKNNASAGSAGVAKGAAGYAIYGYSGGATGIVVNNSGTINGPTYY